MLWKKEKIKGQMIYVKIFDTGISALYSSCNQFMTEILSNVHETSTAKDNTLSDAVLQNAVLMKAHSGHSADTEKILDLVNKAICYAEVGSGKLAGAYGFRAQCFFQLKQYASTLADIELAKKHNYPTQKRSSLETLKNDCLKLLSTEGRKKSALAQPKLSFPADAKVPCFAEGLEVRQSKKYGKHIVTTRALEIGQTVIIEEAYCIRADNSQNYSQCANCFERKANLIPCKNCAAVMFCSQNCYDVGHKKFHAIECRKRGVHTNWEAARRIVLQTVISAIKSFPNIKNMMEVVENFRNRKANNERNYYSDPAIRAYMQFFALGQSVEHTPIMQDFQFDDYTKTIHSAIATNPEFITMFGSLEESRFLAHLILHHFYVVDANGFDALSLLHGTYLTELGTDVENLSGFTYAHGIYTNSSQLNHSCQPNIARIFIGNKLIGKVIRPIKRGEQLFVSYL